MNCPSGSSGTAAKTKTGSNARCSADSTESAALGAAKIATTMTATTPVQNIEANHTKMLSSREPAHPATTTHATAMPAQTNTATVVGRSLNIASLIPTNADENCTRTRTARINVMNRPGVSGDSVR